MNIPAGYHVGDNTTGEKYVLKLKKNLYGLKQTSYNWSELLKPGLLQLEFKQSDDKTSFVPSMLMALYFGREIDSTII